MQPLEDLSFLDTRHGALSRRSPSLRLLVQTSLNKVSVFRATKSAISTRSSSSITKLDLNNAQAKEQKKKQRKRLLDFVASTVSRPSVVWIPHYDGHESPFALGGPRPAEVGWEGSQLQDVQREDLRHEGSGRRGGHLYARTPERYRGQRHFCICSWNERMSTCRRKTGTPGMSSRTKTLVYGASPSTCAASSNRCRPAQPKTGKLRHYFAISTQVIFNINARGQAQA